MIVVNHLNHQKASCPCVHDSVSSFSSSLEGSPLLSALVVISVVLILVVSAVIWFFHQRRNPGSSILNLIEYHPPFRSPSSDQACLVDAEEIEVVP